MPNGFAYLVLLSWPLVAVMLFRVLPLPKAIAWTIIAGYLFLPEQTGFDLPVLPTIDKTLVPALSAAVLAWVKLRDPGTPGPVPAAPGVRRLFLALFGLVLVGPFITALTNADPVIVGEGVLFIPGLRLYDALAILNGIVVMLVPFVLAYRFLATEADHAVLLKVIALAGAAYCLPIFIEARLSPQLNVWIYGFFPHSFLQHIRGGGFRPLVFLNHGLWLAIFMASAVLASAALWRARQDRGERAGWILMTVILLVSLVIVKSLGAFLITMVLLPVMLLARPRGKLFVAALLAGLVLFYPLLRGGGLVPVDWIMSAVESVAPERAQSFGTRLENEDQLLERANLKPLAGWGGWGRPEIYDETSGRRVSVADGAWVIVIGHGGWLRYLAVFGLLALPLIILWRRAGTLRPGPASAGLALVLGAGLVDLLPNGTVTPLTWLLAGAVAGRAQALQAAEPEPEPDRPGRSRPGKTRPPRAPRRRERAAPVRPAPVRRAVRPR